MSPSPLAQIPTLWLLGKTGAGKSSILRALTGLSHIEIGNGFQPCTRTSQELDFPPGAPLMRFLDTRGLGEASYDPTEDLAQLQGASHMVVVVARLDDPAQSAIAAALKDALRRAPMPVLLVLTGADLAPEADAQRSATLLQKTFEEAAGQPLKRVILGQSANGDYLQIDSLREALAEALPEVAVILAQNEASGVEQEHFRAVRPMVLRYAGIAGASDVMPAVGIVSVPATQMALLRELGQAYGANWTKPLIWRFLAALGTGIAARYAAVFGLRQLGKFIPLAGQTVIAAASGGVSFATTYALGRTAAAFLYHHQRGAAVSSDELRSLYRSALRNSQKDSTT